VTSSAGDPGTDRAVAAEDDLPEQMRVRRAKRDRILAEGREVAEVLEAVPFFGSLYDVFINAVARPSTVSAPDYAAVSRAFYTAVHSVLTGTETAADAMAIAEADIQDITGLETGAPTAD